MAGNITTPGTTTKKQTNSAQHYWQPVSQNTTNPISTPIIDDFAAGIAADQDKNIHTSGELGNSAAINNAWDLKESASSIVWVVVALFAVYFGIKLLKHKNIL